MEVTRKNFKELLPEILEAIRTSAFIAIDGEFTGLLDSSSINAFDHPSVYYSKVRKEGMNFLLIQFGLCTFHYDSLLDRYTHKAFNFYVFPYSNGRRNFDTTFLCQTSSMEFLAENKFDFNKLFGEGIPFVNFEGEQKLRDNFEQQKKARELRRSEQSPRTNEKCIPVPEKYATYIQQVCEKIKNFIKSPEKRLELGDQTTGFVRKLIFDAVEKNFKDVGLYAESGIKEGGGRNDRVVILTKEEGSKEEILEQREKDWCKAMLEELNDAIGFSSVIRAITESEKMVVGHNLLLDVCHCIHQFCAPLPEDYDEFKELVLSIFPRLVDTKLISNMYPLKDKIMSTTLMQLMEILSEKPFTLPVVDPADNKSGYSMKDSKSHEAGFDAFVTGVCFISMANYFASLGKKLISSPLVSESPFIKPFINRLYLMKVQDIPYMELTGKDSSPPRDHVFHLTFPSSWNMQNIRQLFSHFGSVFIAWLNDTSAFVALEDRTKASLVCKTLGSKTDFKSDDEYKIIPFLDYVKKNNRKPLPSDNTAKNVKGKGSSSQNPISPGRRNSFPESSPLHSTGGKRKRSLSDSSFSKRSIDPIPEEIEDEVDKEAPAAKRDKFDLVEEDNQVKESKVEDGDGNSKPTTVDHSSRSKRGRKTKIKEFDEDDSWE